MERMENFADKFRKDVACGRALPNMVKQLNKENIDYDLVEALIIVKPELLTKHVKANYDREQLCYRAPEGLHRAVQACDLRAIALICMALPEVDYNRLYSGLSRRKKQFMQEMRDRYLAAKRPQAAA